MMCEVESRQTELKTTKDFQFKSSTINFIKAISTYEQPFDRSNRQDWNGKCERNDDRNGYSNRNVRDYGRNYRCEKKNDRGYGFYDA
ncbi:hypothetical protein CDAR_608331 [Caerostris darwini]|uniref:Uncharacterized protein n=1 Tax=Caerostris darwini TaxID=1538125 RepID=A0AAV4UGQ5_9ARAC|nr:hypothetical protein CDAR_608331 [Caerostris darwini]